MERKKYRWCAVPLCKNTSISTPKKLFIDVPRKADMRKKWFALARRKCYEEMSITSAIYFCEDHFDLPNDMKNYMEYHVMGAVKRIMMEPGCLPSKFQCHTDRKRNLPSTRKSRPAAVKRKRLALKEEVIEKRNLPSTSKSRPAAVKKKMALTEEVPKKRNWPSIIKSRPAAVKKKRLALKEEVLEKNIFESNTEQENTTRSFSKYLPTLALKEEVLEENIFESNTKQENTTRSFSEYLPTLALKEEVLEDNTLESTTEKENTTQSFSEYLPTLALKEEVIEENTFESNTENENTSRSFSEYLPTLTLKEEVLEENLFESNTENENTTPSFNLKIDFVREEQPKSQDKGVQACVKSKYFRSKYTQTDNKFKNIATSPSKTWTTTTSTSTFKGREHVGHVELSSVSKINKKIMNGSDSDISVYTQSTSFQQSSPSVQLLHSKKSSDSNSLNIEETEIKQERETKQVLNNMLKEIEAKQRFYIGTSKDCLVLVDLVQANADNPTEYILRCLNKIRLNTTFSELAD